MSRNYLQYDKGLVLRIEYLDQAGLRRAADELIG